MISLNGYIYVTHDDLTLIGVPKATISNKNFRGIPHPQDARKRIYEFTSLNKKYQQLIITGLCGGLSPEQFLAESTRNTLSKHIHAHPQDVYFFTQTGHYTEAEAQSLATSWAWLKFLNGIKTKADCKALGFATKTEVIEAACVLIYRANLKGLETRGNSPMNFRVLQRKMEAAKTNGRESLISGHVGKAKHCKITEEISNWLIAQHAQPVKGRDTRWLSHYYNTKIAPANNWPQLSTSAIYNHLYRKDIQPIWYTGRHGYAEAIKVFGHTLKLKTASCRDLLWNSDGTKLDWYYKTDDGHKAQLKFYIIMDVFSEVILGWDIDRTENYETQYRSAKMALQFAGHKPNQWIYDGQGGHRKGETQDFLDKVVLNSHHRVRPYRSQAKPIEHAIGRFQDQCIQEYWFCDGKGIKTKKADSHANLEFIKAHLADLPTAEDLLHLFAHEVLEWNNSKHPKTSLSRFETYQYSHNPHTEPLHILEMVDLFWLTSVKPISYYAHGLTMERKGIKYDYEVYDQQGNIDMDFRAKYVGIITSKFFVKYDPENYSEVWLYKQDRDGLVFVAKATEKHAHARAIMDQNERDKARVFSELHQGDAEAKSWKTKLAAIREAAGIKDTDVIADAQRIINEARFAAKDDLHAAEAAYSSSQLEPVQLPAPKAKRQRPDDFSTNPYDHYN